MVLVALVVMNVPAVVGMVVVVKPRDVDVGPSVVIGRLVFAAGSMRMGHHRQLAGKVSQYQHYRQTATQHEPLKKRLDSTDRLQFHSEPNRVD